MITPDDHLQGFTVRLHLMQRTVLPRLFCLSVCLSVRLSNAWIVTQRNKLVPTSSHHMKDHASYFSDKTKNGWWGRPFNLKCWAKLTMLERKRPREPLLQA